MWHNSCSIRELKLGYCTNIFFKLSTFTLHRIYYYSNRNHSVFVRLLQDKKVDECLASVDESCYKIIQEECDYLGALIYKSPPGSIVSSSRCEQLCLHYKFGNRCLYWSYAGHRKTCYLYNSGKRVCHTIGGPERPPIRECAGNLCDLLLWKLCQINHSSFRFFML